MNTKKIKILAAALIMVATYTSCEESLLNENPPNIVTSNSLFVDYEGFVIALNGAYAEARREKETISGSQTIQQMAQNGTDNLVTNHRSSGFATIAAEWRDVNNPTQSFYADVFTWLYSIVNATNLIINEAQNGDNVDWSGGPGSDVENQQLVIAEARALRAWAYRHLTYGWGDVPLNLEPSTGATIRSDWTRTPVGQVREQMIADWRFAEQHISVEPRQSGTLTKGAIQHYLSEMYLVENKADSALYWANKVIDEPAYELNTSRYGVNANKPGIVFMDMFTDGNINRNEGNKEALWVFNYERNTIGGGGNNNSRRDHHSRYVNIKVGDVNPFKVTESRGGRGFGRNSLTKWAIENWTSEDDRGSHFAIRKFFILTEGVDDLPSGLKYGDTIHLDFSEDITPESASRKNWPWCKKVDWTDPMDVGVRESFKDFLYLRLAETYLLRAEAQLKLGQKAEAAESINIIRRRANANEITAGDVDIDFILDERSRELVTEEHRRYTLLRTNKWLERTSLYNARGGQFIADKDKLFPIPQVVIDANLNQDMPNNPGY